jgi:hypothetical protein
MRSLSRGDHGARSAHGETSHGDRTRSSVDLVGVLVLIVLSFHGTTGMVVTPSQSMPWPAPGTVA